MIGKKDSAGAHCKLGSTEGIFPRNFFQCFRASGVTSGAFLGHQFMNM